MRYLFVVASLYALATAGLYGLQAVTINPEAYWVPYVMTYGVATLLSIVHTVQVIWPVPVYDVEYTSEWLGGAANRIARGPTRLSVLRAAHRNSRECGSPIVRKIKITETLTLRKEHEYDSKALLWIHSVWNKLTGK